MQDINAIKERILSVIEKNGPSFPVQIARTINLAPLFTSVFLSELFEDAKLKMSYMKIGSSSLFYLPGQEPQLENFIEYLNQKEKEAFFLLKKSSVLEDSKQTPTTRVALRAIKDFAIPFKITKDGTEKIFWKYYLLSDEDFDKIVQKILNPNIFQDKPKEDKIISKVIQDKTAEADTPESDNKEIIRKDIQNNTKIKKKSQPSEFAEKIKDYLRVKDIEIILPILEKKKEFTAKIRADTIFGKQEYYLIAKDKKKITETDLAIALQKAQSEKMIALIISPGEVDKKAQSYFKDWRNLIKFEKIRL